MASRIGLIGGLSWEATASYYRYFNELHVGPSPWSQPPVLIDSIDMGTIVELQRVQDWTQTGLIMADAARRLVAGGANVLGIGANTMHRNFAEVVAVVECQVIDIRVCVAREVIALGGKSVGVMGTAYVIEQEFYASAIEECGVEVLRPDAHQTSDLQRIIYDELTQGVVSSTSRERLLEIASSLVARGADVVGLCCTELGLLVDESGGEFAVIDSTKAHVRSLLDALEKTPMK
ncbi:MAG: amino acid racemase [Acidimicrobiaceae bacterium]|nr:amino acid racemase [Acidimicrobiaceae bacterium]